MDSNNRLLDMSPVGMRFTVLKNAAETGGRSLDLHWDVLPQCNMKDPLIHIHPHAIETYEVLEGEMEFFVKDHWQTAKKGDSLTVPQGTVHGFRNPSNSIVKVFNTHQPALRMENYFEDVCKVLDKLTGNRTKEFKINLRSMLYMARLMNNYRAEIVSSQPPDAALRILGYVARVMQMNY